MRISTLISALTLAGLSATSALGFSSEPAKVRIGEDNVFPESITTMANGTIFAGSVGTGLVFRAAPGATSATAWTAPQADGPGAVTGILADEKSGLLWVCYADLTAFGGAADAKPSVLRTFSLSDASLGTTYAFDGASFCNDITIAADGTAYVTDTVGARIFRIKPGATELETWMTDPTLGGVDGIALASDGTLYINNVSTGKLYRVGIGSDGAAGALTEIATSSPLAGPDGMRFGEDGLLYLAENGAGQVDALTITGDTAKVKVLKRGYDMPTAVSKSGEHLYVGESKFSKMGGTEDPGKFYVYLVKTH